MDLARNRRSLPYRPLLSGAGILLQMLVIFAVTLGWLNRDELFPDNRLLATEALPDLATADRLARARAAIQAQALAEDPYAYADAPQGTVSNANVLERVADGPSTANVRFGLCYSGGGHNCVVDGDTFWLNGEKIRIADIDTPETHPARCEREAALGRRATLRLHQMLNAGSIMLTPAAGGQTHDRYGRRLAVVEREGASVGMMLVSEGLARPYAGGPRANWC